MTLNQEFEAWINVQAFLLKNFGMGCAEVGIFVTTYFLASLLSSDWTTPGITMETTKNTKNQITPLLSFLTWVEKASEYL